MRSSDSRWQNLHSIQSPQALADSDWNALGFRNQSAVKNGLQELVTGGSIHAGSVIRALAMSSDPDQSWFGLHRWLNADRSILQTSQWRDERFLQTLCILFAATPALSEYFIRYPARTWPVVQPVLERKVHGGQAWHATLSEALASSPGETAQRSTLRRLRVESMLQIAALDLCGVSTLNDTVRALSDLADACTAAAFRLAVENLRAQVGIAAPPAIGDPIPFVVFALGKLGGRELNYSSDIDLVFAHAGSGETSGGARSVHVETYFTMLAEEITTLLDKVTEDGRVYRVDVRLRPHGSAGPLVKAADEMLNYFQSEGRTWERQAWLKARPIAGDFKLGSDLLQKLSTFIFRRYLSLDAIGDLQALKRQIELSVARRGESEDEVKLGRGGIRDIEFTVQFMQLSFGSQHPQVRTGNTLYALHLLHQAGLLSPTESVPLANSYVFLRHVEHRLQLYGDLQVHKLPSDQPSRRRIALSLGYSDSPAVDERREIKAEEHFEIDRQRHTARTREVFERLFANLFRSSNTADSQLSDLLLAPEPDVQRIGELLPTFGFPASVSTATELIDLSRESLILTSPSRTRKFFASVAPQLLRALAATGVGDDALRRFARLAGSIGAKAVFYQMLNETPWMLQMTADLAAWSEYLTDILVANPGLFDELVDSLGIGQSKTCAEMRSELAGIASGGEIGDTLRAFKSGELLRIGVKDLIHSATLDQTQTELSDLAEAILNTQLQDTWKMFLARHGTVSTESSSKVSSRTKVATHEPLGFAVLGLGKFGGREMNYGSDLDVLYFYEGEGQTADGTPASTYYSEMAQEITRTMATSSTLGVLYELDARLRPNGNKGPLAQSLEFFKRYWTEGQLADWERLALTRARFVAGDVALGERALHLIRSAVYSPLNDTRQLAHEVLAMRKRLEETAEEGDLKRGYGGIMDIEFIVQYLQLIHGAAFPPLRQTNTSQALKMLMKFSKLSIPDGKALTEAYGFLRTLENRVRVVHGLSAHKLPSNPEAVRKLALRARLSDATGTKKPEELLLNEYRRHARLVREMLNRIVG